MNEPSSANLELSIALPLGVVANQLTKVEADLRFLSMKASGFARERENGELAAKVLSGLERINEALDLIRGLVADMEAHVQPRPAGTRERASRRPSADRDD
jgi:hypothetical protein